MFPEGTYNQDGYLNQIKKGAYYIKTKIETLHFNCFTLTYDSLSYKKSKLYIKYGKAFQLDPTEPVEKITGIVRDILGENYTVTLGNLVSFTLLKFQKETKIKKDQLMVVLFKLKDQIQAKLPHVSIASELKTENIQNQIETILQKLKVARLIELTNDGFRTLESMYQIPKSLHNLKKTHIVLYHKNQLTSHLNQLEEIWSSAIAQEGSLYEANTN
jgi:hypothetical protein